LIDEFRGFSSRDFGFLSRPSSANPWIRPNSPAFDSPWNRPWIFPAFDLEHNDRFFDRIRSMES
jgi:hypothetical protein